jgi:hypothetical protein
MILNGFTGRKVSYVERENCSVKVVFDDGGYLFVRGRGPEGTYVKLTCTGTRCKPRQCRACRGIDKAPSE